ncbi:hypothetical protein [Streptomyces sp. NPDC057413]|uniref:hypothetical protein n=1 Tax=Streptomyces sp. NPDC057413 TaxID=3346124 RepID=UPI0036ABD2A6
MTGNDETFPACLDQWTREDWQEYRDRIEAGEGSATAIDVIILRRRARVPEPAW